MNRFSNPLVLFLCFTIVGCGSSSQDHPQEAEPEFSITDKVPDDPLLAEGRQIWLQSCQTCHGTGLAGAPVIGTKEAWQPRLQKGEQTLISHAINGFLGPSGTEMPAKGGDETLSDDDVTKAALYMINTTRAVITADKQ